MSASIVRARIAAATRWAAEADRTAATAPARAALRRADELAVDPDDVLAPEELARRVASRRRVRALKAAYARWHGGHA